jgi:hypothetical protein
VTTDIR